MSCIRTSLHDTRNYVLYAIGYIDSKSNDGKWQCKHWLVITLFDSMNIYNLSNTSCLNSSLQANQLRIYLTFLYGALRMSEAGRSECRWYKAKFPPTPQNYFTTVLKWLYPSHSSRPSEFPPLKRDRSSWWRIFWNFMLIIFWSSYLFILFKPRQTICSSNYISSQFKWKCLLIFYLSCYKHTVKQ